MGGGGEGEERLCAHGIISYHKEVNHLFVIFLSQCTCYRVEQGSDTANCLVRYKSFSKS